MLPQDQKNTSLSSYLPMSEINVTPFVDVMLVLLVIFMVTAPMMVDGFSVQLPKASTQPMVHNEEKLTLTLTKDRRAFLGQTEIKLQQLGEFLKSNEKIKRDKEIWLQADEGLSYGFVIQVMAELKSHGIENISMITDPKENSSD